MKEESKEPKIEIENHSSLPKAKLAQVLATAMAIMAKRQKQRAEAKAKDAGEEEKAGGADEARDPNCGRCRYDEFNLMVVPEFRESQARMMAKAIGPHKCGKK